MRHPFWILNSALLLLFFIALDFIIFSQYKIPSSKSITPGKYVKPTQKSITQVNIEKIYENDLFNTYVPEPVEPEIGVPPVITMPEPPPPHRATLPAEPKPQFLEPLKISLKGTIIISENEKQNRTIIEDEETAKEKIYKVGDKIEDAQLLRIMHNKIILVRSNGQQEILYLREKDTKLDPLYATLRGWDSVIERESDNEYLIYPTTFNQRVKSLGQFIDMLDLTTVFKQGKNMGTRVGYLAENSLGIALGLQRGDVVLKINGIPATTTPNRVKIYRSIVSLEIGDTIKVSLVRSGQEKTIFYRLAEKKQDNSAKMHTARTEKKVFEEKIDVMSQQFKVAPTAREIRIQERKNMRNLEK